MANNSSNTSPHAHASEDDAATERPPYADYQLEIYSRGILSGELPTVTCDPNRLEEQARQKMAPEAFNYAFGGAGAQQTVLANREAFLGWKLVPRFLRPTDGPIEGAGESKLNVQQRKGERTKMVKKGRDLSVELFGGKQRYATPIIMAPVGVQGIFHPDGEKGVARACAELDVVFTLSTASTSEFGEVASEMDDVYHGGNSSATATETETATTPPKAPRWFQLYRPLSNSITSSLLRRAWAAGYTVLVVTLDTFALSWRPLDLDAAYLPFVTGTGNKLGFTDPVFRSQFSALHDGESVEENVLLASRMWTAEAFSGHAHSWKDLEFLRREWKGEILLKGIQDARDAEMAAKSGCIDGIIVSNHGGRQLDGAVGALDVLPEIVDKVKAVAAAAADAAGGGKKGEPLTVLFDSGIRTGTDVMKALALGAQAVMVGRPVIYGLGIDGERGARHVLAGLLAELDQSMGLSGVKSVRELVGKRDMLRRAGARAFL